jgi:hypothetical protein
LRCSSTILALGGQPSFALITTVTLLTASCYGLKTSDHVDPYYRRKHSRTSGFLNGDQTQK